MQRFRAAVIPRMKRRGVLTAAMELEMLADGYFLEFDGRRHGGTWAGDFLEHAGVDGCWVWTGCVNLVLRF